MNEIYRGSVGAFSEGPDLDAIVQSSCEIDHGLFVLAKLGDRDEDPVLTRATMAAELFIPLHSHDARECLHVFDGGLEVYRGDLGSWFAVASGQSITIPSGTPHAIRNTSGRAVDALAVITVKLASFVTELGVVAAAAGLDRSAAERRRSLGELAERYGYWLAPSDQNDAIRHRPVCGDENAGSATPGEERPG